MGNKRHPSAYAIILRFGMYYSPTKAPIDPYGYVKAMNQNNIDLANEILLQYKRDGRKLIKGLANSLRRHFKTSKGTGIRGKISMVISCSVSVYEKKKDLEIVEMLYEICPNKYGNMLDFYKRRLNKVIPVKLHIHVLNDVDGGATIINEWIKKYWLYDHKYGSVATQHIDNNSIGWWHEYSAGQCLIRETVNV